MLVILIVAQLAIVVVAAQNIGVGDTIAPNPVVLYNGAPIDNNAVIHENAVLSILYEFNVNFNDLTGVIGTLPLPSFLLPSFNDPISILGTDSSGLQYEIGELKCDSGMIITANFFPAETVPVNDTPTGFEETNISNNDVTPSGGNTYSGGIDAIFPDKPREPEPEEINADPEVPLNAYPESFTSDVITVSIEIPCAFDLANIPAAQNGGQRIVTLTSNGQDVAIILFSDDVQVLEEQPEVQPEEQQELLPTVQPVAIALVGIVPAYVPAGLPKLEDYATITDVAFSMNYNEIAGGNTVTISTYDQQISLEYQFEIRGEKAKAVRDAIAATTSSYFDVGVDIPEGLKAYLQSEMTDTIQAIYAVYPDNSRKKFADLIVDSTGVYLRFCGEFWETTDDLQNANIYVICQLDKTAIGNKSTYTIEFTVPKEYSVTFNVPASEAKKDHSISKKGLYNSNTREITWTVTFSPSETDDHEHQIVDEFINTNQDYVADSLYEGNNKLNDATCVSTTGSTTTIKHTITSVSGNTNDVKLVYKTKVNATAFADYANATVLTNYVKLMEKDKADAVASATASATVYSSQKQWITKKSTGVTKDIISWEVTITAFDFGVSNVKLTDTISKGQTLVEDSVRVDGNSATASNFISNADGSTTFDITVESGALSSKKTFVVKYNTKVNEGLFATGSSLKFNNTARLSFTSSQITSITPAATVTGVGVDNHIINKAVTDSSTVNHTITWTITVNPYNLNVTDGKVTDNLKNIGLKYISGLSSGTYTYDEDTGELIINVGNIGTATKTYTIVTEVISTTSYYGLNVNETFTNTAYFNGKVKVNNVDETVTDQASADKTFVSSVITKSAASYHYGDNIVTWCIRVNANKMSMPTATIEDTLDAGLSYDPAKGVRYGTSSTEDANLPKVTNVMYNNKTLTINLGNLADGKEIYVFFDVAVDPDVYEISGQNPFLNSTSFDITNSATLKRTGSGYADVSSNTGTKSVNNEILYKDYKISTVTSVSYSVNIDTHGMENLMNGVLVDTIPVGLELQVDTIKIYEVTEVDKDRKFTTAVTPVKVGTDISNTVNSDIEIIYNRVNNGTAPETLTIKFNSALKRYVLTYDCTIITGKAGNYTNTVALTANGLDSNIAKSSKNLVYSGGSGRANSVKIDLEIIKRNGDTNQPLSDVSFELWYKSTPTDHMYDYGKTDSNGRLVFPGIPSNLKYYLKETTPAGYDANVTGIQRAISVGVASPVSLASIEQNGLPLAADATSCSFTVYNYKKGQIVVTKLDDDTKKPIKDVGFKLTSSSGTVYNGFTDSDGKLIFKDLPRNYTYTLEETSATGYVLASAKVVATNSGEQPQLLSSSNAIILDKENIGVTVYNYKKPPDDDTGGTNPPYIPGTRSFPLPDPPAEPTPTPTPTPVPTPAPTPLTEPEIASTTSVEPFAEDAGEEEHIIETREPPQPGTTFIVPDINSPDYEEAPGGHGWPPVDPGTTLVYTEDGGFIEIDDEGTPIGIWTYDEDNDTWIFDEIVPLGGLPQTGIVNLFPIILVSILFGVSLILAGLLIKMRGSKKNG